MNGSYWPVASFDWPTALSGWTTSQVASWLHSLPAPRQQMLHMHLPTSTSDTVMEFAVLGHTAAYLLGRSGALMQIERWAPASRYHLVTTSNKQARLTAEQLPSGALPLARTSVHSTEALSPWATNLHGNLTRRASGPGAIPCWKLFAPFVPTLAAVPRLIFLDSDLLLLESPQPLWAHFDAFSPRHLIGLALNHDGMTGLNSGVLLLHLERMRADGKWARMLHAASTKLERQPPKVRLGWLADQTFLSFLAAWQFETNSLYPPHSAPLGDRLYSVPCGWNRQLSVARQSTHGDPSKAPLRPSPHAVSDGGVSRAAGMGCDPAGRAPVVPHMRFCCEPDYRPAGLRPATQGEALRPFTWFTRPNQTTANVYCRCTRQTSPTFGRTGPAAPSRAASRTSRGSSSRTPSPNCRRASYLQTACIQAATTPACYPTSLLAIHPRYHRPWRPSGRRSDASG